MNHLFASLLFAAVLVPLAPPVDDPQFPKPPDTEKSSVRPLPAAEAARGFKVPEGFAVDVFASEPDVRNPIALTFDGRGRLWVAENYTYSDRTQKFDLGLRDRVLIFTDKDGDGRPEKRQVFIDNVQRLTSVEVGLGGVWLMCPPRLLFVPDRDGDDKPDGPPEVVLDGFHIPPENYHNFANGLRWGPDGWLYGRTGGSAPGRIRVPSDPPEAVVPLHGAIWRYHPHRRVFEPLAHGTTNPWGHDWNEVGEAFFVNSVNGHLWHVIPGAHYHRSSTIDPNPLAYAPMKMHADHWHHEVGKDLIRAKSKDDGTTDQLGGGHAHSGCMIYLGDQWPNEYRGRMLMFNLHGQRANALRLERSGCGYAGKREPDMLFASDPFFRGLDMRYGPDGSVFVIDWSDTGECHEHDGVHRNSGRIYRVRYGTNTRAAPDVGGMTDRLLAELSTYSSEWFVRQARQELANRVAAGRAIAETRTALIAQLPQASTVSRLRVLWTLHTLGHTNAEFLRPLLRDGEEMMRVWAIRLLTDNWPLDTVVGQSRAENVNVPAGLVDEFVRLAQGDSSGLVRLALASTLQRLPLSLRPKLAAALLSRSEDADDPNQPMLLWYSLTPLALKNPQALLGLAAESRIPLIRRWTARYFAEQLAKQPALLDGLLAKTSEKNEAVRRDIIAGLVEGFAGVRKAVAPASWKSYPRKFSGEDVDSMRATVQGLDAVFGDGRALDDVRRLALDDKADLKLRQSALQTLIDTDAPALRAVCEKLLGVRFLNTLALQGLTRFDDPAIARLLAKSYRKFHPSERPPVIAALASRPSFASELLNLIANGTVARSDLAAVQARQIRSFNRPELTERLNKVWGELRDSPREKTDLITKLKAELTTARLASADKQQGRALFAKNCANCHRLFGSGEEIGPDLTGAGRKDLDYLLSNIVDPSAVLNQDYQVSVLTLTDGRAITGVVLAERDAALTVQTDQQRLTILRTDIEDRRRAPQSLMPDGLLQALTSDQIRDLLAYLMSDSQVELPR